MREQYDIAVIGSGFAGSLIGMIAKKLGYSVVLLESGRHPRFAIGESSTPLSNLLLEELTVRYDLPRLTPLSKWGTWQEHYPEIAGGLKRGFSFFHHEPGQRFRHESSRANQLLVAASPHDRIADVHWYRAEVDTFFAEEAQQNGVAYFDEVCLDRAIEGPECVTLEGSRKGADFRLRASFVLDGSGPRGFLHNALRLPEVEMPFLPSTQALYTHFTGVRRFADCTGGFFGNAPYPVDDAAVHHVFPGGWMWVLRFNNGKTSAGVVVSNPAADRYALREGATGWARLLHDLPSVRDQFADAETVRPFIFAPQVSFRSGRVAGERWALLPSCAGFVDPILSTGFALTLLGVSRLAEVLRSPLSSEEFQIGLQKYARTTDEELVAAGRLIAGLYAGMESFPVFSELSLLYFAAASYSETARRLGKPELAPSFLLHDHCEFGRRSREIVEDVLKQDAPLPVERIRRDVREAIEPINVAGLGNEARGNWYPVEAEDLLVAAEKLQSSRHEIGRLLDRCGFWDECV